MLCCIMRFLLLFWAESYLLMLCGVCQPEKTAMGLKEAVKSDTVITAALGGEANFYCNFSLSMDVLQVTWQKRNGSSFQNIVTYSPKHGLWLMEPFQKKAYFTIATMKASTVTLQNLTFEDESNYRCIFNVFPHGSFSKDVCLNIQTISELTVEYDSHLITEGLLTVVCSATGKPAPKITLVGDNDLEESSETHHVLNANGTVTVAIRRTFFATKVHGLTCILDHPQGRKIKAVYPEKGREGVQKFRIIVGVLTTVLSLILIYCIVSQIFRKRSKLKRSSAPRTPAKEKGLHQDLSEKTMTLNTLKDQQVLYHNEDQAPVSSLCKRSPSLKRNPREKKSFRCLISEEAENLNCNVHSVFEGEPVGLFVKELGCMPLQEDREITVDGGDQIPPHPCCSPAQEQEISAR